MNRDDIAAILRQVEDFRVVLQSGEMFLDCPVGGCAPSVDSLSTSMALADLQEMAEEHLVSEHLPALPPGHHRCHGCYVPVPTGRGFGRYCAECAQ